MKKKKHKQQCIECKKKDFVVSHEKKKKNQMNAVNHFDVLT